MPPHDDPSATTTTGGSDDAVEDLLFELLELPPRERAAGMDGLCRTYPHLAETLRRRYRLAAEFELVERVPAERARRERFGAFTLIRELGHGVATVYLADDGRPGRKVALKVFHRARLTDEAAAARLRREVAAAARVWHPGICPVYDAGLVDGVPWVSMRHVPGETLAAWIDGRRRALAAGSEVPADRLRAVAWIEQVARTLHAAHREGLVHGAVKPSHVVIAPAGAPVLIDFGLANDPVAAESGGVPTWLSPEQLAPGEHPVGPASDVWGLGAVLYECLTLRPPCAAASRDALRRAILAGPPPAVRRFARFVSRDLASVIARALARDAGRRYPTAAAFAEGLRRARRGDPMMARRRGALRRWLLRVPGLGCGALPSGPF